LAFATRKPRAATERLAANMPLAVGMPPGQQPSNAVELFVALVTAAAVIGVLVRRILPVPYTVALVVFGLGAALIAPSVDGLVTPDLVLTVLLPGLIFEAAYRIHLGELRRSWGGVVLLAAPGVVLGAAITAAALLLVGLPFHLGFVVGAMVAATDPAAVVATFRRLHTPRGLSTLVEGESLFNDGTALVVFAIALRAATSEVSVVEAVAAFLLTVVGSLAIGGVIGFIGSRIMTAVNDHLVESTISLAAAYGAYIVADTFHESGIIATVVAGIVIGNYGRRVGMSERSEAVLDTIWEFLAFLLTALVFLLVGLVISVPDLLDALPAIAVGVVGVLVGRAVAVYGLLGGASRIVGARTGRHIPGGWLHVMFWAGLRGAVAVAMALSLPQNLPDRQLLQQITFGIVLFTLLVQGTSVELVIRWSGASANAANEGEA
jgi:CPA1 family monovalent cation:H+ antiporter